MEVKRKYKRPNTASLARRTFLKRPEGWDKKCRRCGKDPWTNYYYCGYCNEVVTRSKGGGASEWD